MEGEPIPLDGHRGMAAQRDTDSRRLEAGFLREQALRLEREGRLEQALLASPAVTWQEAAEKASYLVALFGETPEGRDPRRHRLVEAVLDDIARLAGDTGDPSGAAGGGRR